MGLILYMCCDLALSLFMGSKKPSPRAKFIVMMCLGMFVTLLVIFGLFRHSLVAACTAFGVGLFLSLLLSYSAARYPHY